MIAGVEELYALTETPSPVQTNTILVGSLQKIFLNNLNIESTILITGTLQSHKWENAMTVDTHTWGFRRNSNLSAYISIEDLIWQLVSTVR